MIQKRIPYMMIFTLGFLIMLGTVTALAANSTVSISNLDEQSTPLSTVNDKKPAECSVLNLTAVIECPNTSGICNGTNENELIIGSMYNDEINGGKGGDCILGGDGDDTIDGEQGKDVCVGGLGSDSLRKCETDIQ